MKLRDYQIDALDQTMSAFESGSDAALIVLATGLGKTVIAGHVARRMLETGSVMLIAHREELVFQAQKTLGAICDIDAEIEMAGEYARRSDLLWGGVRRVVVSTVQTQVSGMRQRRMERFDPAQFSLLIVDEAHHATAKSYRKTISHYRQNPNLKVLGLTATPDRNDEAALGQIFDSVPCEYDIIAGVADGWLVPIRNRFVDVEGLDLSNLHARMGDLAGSELAAVLEEERVCHEMATPVLDLTGDDKTLVFTASVDQAKKFAEVLNRHKPGSAEYVCGKTPKDFRRGLFRRYEMGEVQYLVNVGVTTEGWDCPGVRWIVMGRPTLSRSLYTQMAGRGTRPVASCIDGLDTPAERRAAIAQSDKPYMTILDFVGNHGRHKLVHATDVLGGRYDDDIVEIAKKAIRESDDAVDIPTALQQAEREYERRNAEREESARLAALKARSIYQVGEADAFAAWDIKPCRVPGYMQSQLATEKQIECLGKFHISIPPDTTRRHASQLIDAAIKRRNDGLCTYRQAMCLRRAGYDPARMSFVMASKLIGEIKSRQPR